MLVASAVAVFTGIIVGSDLTLVFDPLQLAALAAAALGSTLIARGGETNWLEGLQLLTIYLIVGGRRLAALRTGGVPHAGAVPDPRRGLAALADRVPLAVHGGQHLGRHEGGRDRRAGLVVERAARKLAGEHPRP